MTPGEESVGTGLDDLRARDVTLLDLADRLLDRGVVLSGDVTLSVADVDLVYVGLRVLLSSTETLEQRSARRRPSPQRRQDDAGERTENAAATRPEGDAAARATEDSTARAAKDTAARPGNDAGARS